MQNQIELELKAQIYELEQRLAHIIYWDSTLRIKQIIDTEHKAIKIESGRFYEKHRLSPFDEYVGVAIRDDYE